MKNLISYELHEVETSKEYMCGPGGTALNGSQTSFLDLCAKNWKCNPETHKFDISNFYGGKKDLTDLRGIEFGVCDGNFFINDNNLNSLKGIALSIQLSLDISNNNLSELDSIPIFLGKDFFCYGNPLLKPEDVFKIEIGNQGKIHSDFGEFDTIIARMIRVPMSKGKSFSEVLLDIWSMLSDQNKKDLYKFLPNEGTGKIIKRSNKFGMNI